MKCQQNLIIGLAGSFFGIFSTLATAYGVQFSAIQMPAPPGRSEPYPFIIELSSLTDFLHLSGRHPRMRAGRLVGGTTRSQ